jgi:hypothetical protein
MRNLRIQMMFALVSLAALAGCSGGGTVNTSGGGGSQSSTATYTFTGGTPTAAAVQIGAGAFTSAMVQSNKLSVSIPSGTSTYAVAYVCPPAAGFGNTVTAENVIEANVSDGTAFTVSCGTAPTASSAVTGSVNASAIPGAANVLVRGNQGFGASVGAATGSFSANMMAGNNDVAFVAVDGSGNVLAVKILRSQTAPGAINGGASVVFAAGDATTTQSITVNGVPSGYVTPPSESVEYATAGGTLFYLSTNATTQYPAVPSATVETGDYYSFQANTDDTATHTVAVGVMQDSAGGGSATLALPSAWTFTAPAAAVLPTFNFSYSGFSSMNASAQQGEIEWAPTASTLDTVTVTATAAYQGSATAITIPNLSAMTGFLGSATAGATVYWVADMWGGSAQEFAFFGAPPASGNVSFVQKSGTFIEP